MCYDRQGRRFTTEQGVRVFAGLAQDPGAVEAEVNAFLKTEVLEFHRDRVKFLPVSCGQTLVVIVTYSKRVYAAVDPSRVEDSDPDAFDAKVPDRDAEVHLPESVRGDYGSGDGAEESPLKGD